MKKYITRPSRTLAAVLAVASFFAALPLSAASLSPALRIIADEYPIAKCGLVGTDIYFDIDDFSEPLGVESVGRITVTRLPDATVGRLQLGARYVEVGQTISEKNLDALKFVPYGSDEVSASFSFCRGSDIYGTEYDCTVYALKKVNVAPTVNVPKSVSASTGEVGVYSGVTHLGTLMASDPDGDALRFEILSGAAHGSVKLTDKVRGYYEYTSDENFTGKDSFTVRVSDKYGNRSAPAKIVLRVDKPEDGEVFSDTDGHWSCSAVITCVRAGAITPAAEGELFHPDEKISRAQFLALAMSAAGYKGFSASNTGFADDKDIPTEYKGAVALADALGIIEGIATDGGVKFYPNNQITRCEAAVIVSRITGISDDSVSVFAEDDAVPAWAKSAMYGLGAAGILRGDGNGSLDAYTPLSRGAAAQLVSAIVTN